MIVRSRQISRLAILNAAPAFSPLVSPRVVDSDHADSSPSPSAGRFEADLDVQGRRTDASRATNTSPNPGSLKSEELAHGGWTLAVKLVASRFIIDGQYTIGGGVALAVDRAGALHVSSFIKKFYLEVNNSGRINVVTVSGIYGTTPDRTVAAIAVDAAGAHYIVEENNSRVRELVPGGRFAIRRA